MAYRYLVSILVLMDSRVKTNPEPQNPLEVDNVSILVLMDSRVKTKSDRKQYSISEEFQSLF